MLRRSARKVNLITQARQPISTATRVDKLLKQTKPKITKREKKTVISSIRIETKQLSHNESNKTIETIVSDTTLLKHRIHEYEKALEHLVDADPKLGKLIAKQECTVYKKKAQDADNSNVFKSLASGIIFQQISGKAAASIRRKFIALFDPPTSDNETEDWFPTPEMVITKSIEELRTAGLSQRKAEYIQDLAQKFFDKEIEPHKFQEMTDAEISKTLCAVRGIGQWTVDMLLMFNYKHPDILPVTDLGIRKAMAIHFSEDIKKMTPETMKKHAQIWQPYRSIACWYMWRSIDTKTM